MSSINSHFEGRITAQQQSHNSSESLQYTICNRKFRLKKTLSETCQGSKSHDMENIVHVMR